MVVMLGKLQKNTLARQFMTSIRSAIEQAVALFGSERELARACGVVQNTIWKAKRSEVISISLAKAIHKATGGKVAGSDLRPDVWRSPDHVPLDGTRAKRTSPPCPKPNRKQRLATTVKI